MSSTDGNTSGDVAGCTTGCNGSTAEAYLGGTFESANDKTSKELMDRVAREHTNNVRVIGENNIFSSDRANTNTLHDQLVPPVQPKYDVDEWKEVLNQNENKATMVRRRDFFPKFYKRPPMKTIDNIKILGYQPGPKELSEYWCSGDAQGR
jgi:hypothetical protein